ncbi:MAG: hypothetical protein JJ975_15680 [Bacteroidia bacterium]|nr:hypothetical protein [Bacteroidia bacterium]
MSENNHISPDEVFKTGLDGHEADFLQGDWDQMLDLLEEDAVHPVPFQTKTRKRNTIFNLRNILLMSIFSILTAGILYLTAPTGAPNKALAEARIKPIKLPYLATIPAETASTSPIVITPNQGTTTTSETTLESESGIAALTEKPSEPFVMLSSNEQGQTGNPIPAEPQITDPPKKNSKPKTGLLEKVETAVDTAKFYKAVTTRRWIDTTYKWVSVKPSRDIEEGWIGLYYSNQQMEDAALWDSMGRLSENSGFNIQFMSGNLLPGENLAIYGGLDWGMQFFGRSDKDEVLINSVNEDRGVTFMRSHVNDVFVSGQMEWAQFPIIPYVTGSVGTRIFSTGQTTRALLESSEYESSSDNGLLTRAALATKIGVGARMKISPHVHLDFRYEMIQSRDLNVVDYSATSFNGLDYDLGITKTNLNSSQFRFGIVFDVHDEEEKVVDKPGYWKEETQELFMDPNDSNKIYVPCPCKPCDENKRRQSDRRQGQFDWNIFDDNDGPDISPGGGWGGGKGGFPGVKSPPIKH